MKFISYGDEDFDRIFPGIVKRNIDFESRIYGRVKNIVDDVRKNGDKALIRLTQNFDGWEPKSGEDLIVKKKEIEEAEKKITKEEREAIEKAAERIERYHKKQFPWKVVYKENGTRIERVAIPLERVGIYSPGGKAAYPSTLLMTAIPAKVAGVREIYITTPCPQGEANPYILFTAKVLGIHNIFKVGGAQAIAAFAFGTETIPQVEKICGPGNIFVSEAKRIVQGIVGIDLIAGPSEIVILADGSCHPVIPALDILAQAEHDERALTVVVSPERTYLEQIKNSIVFLLQYMPRKDIIKEALRTSSFLIHTPNMDTGIEIVNKIAPEHVEVLTKNMFSIAKKIKNAGAIFVGPNSPVALGDYIAGPSHVLPTGGTARFSSGLSVDDFLKKTNIIFFTKKRMIKYGEYAKKIAEMEGLYGHAYSIEERIREKFIRIKKEIERKTNK